MHSKPIIINGNNFEDARGKIIFNNNFNMSTVKRTYVIENISIDFKRGWKGHKIEKRWFNCSKGKILIKVVNLDFFKDSDNNHKIYDFVLTEKTLDILFVPPYHATMIKQLNKKSRVQVYSDYYLGESNDENIIYEFKD